MKPRTAFKGFLSLVFAALLLAGCADKMEPAKKAITEIEAVVKAVGPDVRRYVPDDLKTVKAQLATVEAKFAQKDYKGVLADAPSLLEQAKALAPAAAAKKAEAMAVLPAQWTELATAAPASIAALESRLAAVSMGSAPGADPAAIEAAKKTLTIGKNMWQMANEAHAAGRLEEAVGYAKYVKEKADAALASLGAPAA
jgi:hypothetical protein